MQTIVIFITILVNISQAPKTNAVAELVRPSSPLPLTENKNDFVLDDEDFSKAVHDEEFDDDEASPANVNDEESDDETPPANSDKLPIFKNFEEKYDYFKKQLRKKSKWFPFVIRVSRDQIFNSSYYEIKFVSKYLLLSSWFIVRFKEEKGAGRGLVREWFSLVTQEIIKPSQGLFDYIDEENFYLRINPRTEEKHYVDPFKFVGRVFGLAVFHNIRLKASLNKSFYLTMLGREVELKHVESFDPIYYRSLKKIKENPRAMGLTFSVDEIVSNERVVHNLKENGDSISVTEDNVDEYIDLIIQWNYVMSIQPQMSDFLEGFHALIPSSLLKIFDENELELIMCGDAKSIDVEDWKNNTRYSGYKKDSEIISWFWKIVSEFNSEKKSKLLQYVTGTFTLPIGGFKELKQKFYIAKKGNQNDFPGASTCDYTLYLPPYESYQRLEDELNALVRNDESTKFTKV